MPEQPHNSATVRTDSGPVTDTGPLFGKHRGRRRHARYPDLQCTAGRRGRRDFKLVERNEVTLTAAAAAPTPAESSWLTYVLVLLGGARGGNDGALVPEYARR
jgi:hypothetical protein